MHILDVTCILRAYRAIAHCFCIVGLSMPRRIARADYGP